MKCARCGKILELGDVRFPFPENQVLCKKCFGEAFHELLVKFKQFLESKHPLDMLTEDEVREIHGLLIQLEKRLTKKEKIEDE